ncbi:hypothetical protein KW849_08315 [Pseudomonas sp. PDM26]|uniref:hypothetical protein n=1 Tax=Pseudomonas sp. PDM26 TaxID=2854766 RepID=UPI001C473792|nr:hypothetical protein [Pseudomonas sp. PDM26]MBV7546298.1 hypothetical protein [Pseudomonas sp. PDM26]
MDSLAIALTALALPKRHQLRSEEAKNAAVIGMAGTSAEQALAAILIQVMGDEAAFVAGSQYKSASTILEEVRDLLRRPPSRAAFLTAGVPDADVHRQQLLEMSLWFRALLSFRAAGLHGGRGVGIDVAVEAVNRVYSFLNALGKSTRVKPYLEALPSLELPARQIEVLLEQLVSQLNTAESITDRAQALRSIFLVLPDIPAEEPGWLQALDRVAVVPTAGDVALLMAIVHEAVPGRLIRAAGGGPAIPVAIRPNVPGALPVEAAHLRREFRSIGEQFNADIPSANGRLREGVLHLPPADFQLDLFQLTQEQLVAELGHRELTGQMAWPFIAAAFSVSRATIRPYWFVVRLVAEEQLQHLAGFLRQAVDAANRASFTERINEVLAGIEAVRRETAPPAEWTSEIRGGLSRAEQTRAALADRVGQNAGSPRELPELLGTMVVAFSTGLIGASDLWQFFMEQHETIPQRHREAALGYWYRLIAEAATEPNDRAFLAKIVADNLHAGAVTAARKSLRVIDAHLHGPTLPAD